MPSRILIKGGISVKEKFTLMDALIYFVIFVIAVICIYPIIYIASMSISDPVNVVSRNVWLLPKGFSLEAYELLFKTPQILTSYYNTIWYTVIGTSIQMILTVAAAYTLSINSFFLRKPLSLMITLTMFFSGGLIPTFIIVTKLGLYNTRWAIVLPCAVSSYNLIVARTYFESLPASIAESAKIDGANDITILFRLILPLSKAILAVLVLFYGVYHWNNYFYPTLYLSDSTLQPLQCYLQKILISMTADNNAAGQFDRSRSMNVEQLKYSTIMVSVIPIMMVYPFVQKYFSKGVMIGAIKG